MISGCLCKQKDFFTPTYNYWCQKMKEVPRIHRKQWEYVMISEALSQRNMLKPGMRGLGFGVGKEPLPSLFASFGCYITATDQMVNQKNLKQWTIAESCTDLNYKHICHQEQFDALVEFRNVDMKHVPQDLNGKYDFIWSSCSLEHIGKLQDGLDFIMSSLDCLKPGGWAIHTTEYSIDQNYHASVYGNCVYSQKYIKKIKNKLEKYGHYVEHINFERGDMEFDKYIDRPPYKDAPHINLAIEGLYCWISATSIILIIRKDETENINIIKMLKNRIYQYRNISVKNNIGDIDCVTPTNPDINNINHRDCIYLGDYKALTKTIFGHKIFVDTRDMSMAPHILLDGYWEMWITNIFMNLVKEGMNVIDIGANIGYYSLMFASKIKNKGRLFAFEADPEIFDILHKNMDINGFLCLTELVNKAVTDKQGTMHFNKRKRHHGSSSIANLPEEFLILHRDSVEILNVETISLDEYFKNRNLKIDILKIDAEGSEPFIFDGMKELIDKNPDMIVICEFNPGMIYGTKKDPRKFLEEIERIGFTLKYIDTNSNIVDISIGELLKKDVCELYLER